MDTEVWFRNPDLYIKEVVECAVPRIAFDRGYAIKKRIDPIAFADLYYPASIDYRVLLIGVQGCAEYTRGDTIEKPTAVYPTWDYTEDNLTMLEELIANPVGENEDICRDSSVAPDERPVFGQEHRIVVVNLPISGSGPGRRILRQISELQAEYPECKIHIHGLYGFRSAFSHGFGAVDIEARTTAAKGKVILPNGKEMRHEMTITQTQWVRLLGFSPVDLETPRMRCMFIIKSALWAGENFTKNVAFRTRGDMGDPAAPLLPATTKDFRSRRVATRSGDKFHCDSCSLAASCKYYREGSVCNLPDAETSTLVRMFKSRDAEQIVDGLSSVLGTQAERLEYGLALEEVEGELSGEVTKIAHGLLTHGSKLARMLNPDLAGRPQVGVFVSGQATVTQNPKGLVGGIVAQLVAAGVPRDRITEEMVINLLAGGEVTPKAIEGVVTDVRAG